MVRTIVKLLLLAVCALCASNILAADFHSLYVQGNQAYSQKDYATALQLYQESEQANPKAGQPVWGEANCLYRQGKKADALAAYRRAQELMPNNTNLKARISAVEEELNTAAPQQAAAPAAAASQDFTEPHFSIGVGYPDIRVRYAVWGPLDLEAKVAAGSGAVAYAGRIYWRAVAAGPVGFLLGGEVGGTDFSGLDSLDGAGYYYEPFVGAQYTFLQRWSLQADLGPAWIQESSHGVSVTDQQWIANFALYYAIF